MLGQDIKSLLLPMAVHSCSCAAAGRAAVRAMPADQVQESDSAFAPNLVNSMCYLVEQTIQVGWVGGRMGWWRAVVWLCWLYVACADQRLARLCECDRNGVVRAATEA